MECAFYGGVANTQSPTRSLLRSGRERGWQRQSSVPGALWKHIRSRSQRTGGNPRQCQPQAKTATKQIGQWTNPGCHKHSWRGWNLNETQEDLYSKNQWVQKKQCSGFFHSFENMCMSEATKWGGICCQIKSWWETILRRKVNKKTSPGPRRQKLAA